MTRQIVLDTETTGIGAGHRIIEIGCVVLEDRRLTNETFHVYLNPKRAVDPGAFRVHGISDEFLKDKPLFSDVFQDFMTFVKGAELIIHNAPFDVGFLNTEFQLLRKKDRIEDFCTVTCTLSMAKKKHPGQKNNLDALCTRYDVDNSGRDLHGALLDAQILADVYLAMTGGQVNLFSDDDVYSEQRTPQNAEKFPLIEAGDSKVIFASQEELKAHDDMVAFLVKKSGIDLWTSDS